MVVLDLLLKGGWMMFVILGVSIVGMAITLERLFTLYLKGRLNVDDFIRRTMKQVEAQDYRGAMESCNISTTHPLPDVLKAGLAKANRREREIERAMEQKMLAAMPRLQRGIGVLGLMGNISTLLGLLGTIFGLIQAFSAVSAASAAQRQMALADGISVAMFTTAFGLIVAVPILSAHTVISGRVDMVLVEIEEGASALLGALSARMGSQKS